MVEVKADLNDNMININSGSSRPKSSLDGAVSTSSKARKKKKKKVKRSKHDAVG